MADSHGGQAYQCGDLRIEVSLKQDLLLLVLPHADLRLTRVVAASGARYADPAGNEFWGKGLEAARLTLAGEETVACVATAAPSPWAEARRRGVIFRALGQEPGWVAEISQGETPRMRLILDYGLRELTFHHLGLQTDEADRLSGVVGTRDGTRAELRILRESCRDSMSGERIETTVKLSLNEEILHGCGRFLAD